MGEIINKEEEVELLDKCEQNIARQWRRDIKSRYFAITYEQ